MVIFAREKIRVWGGGVYLYARLKNKDSIFVNMIEFCRRRFRILFLGRGGNAGSERWGFLYLCMYKTR